jgi:methylated-DNA-[protein]-cysteine S-methyltransferase
LADDPQERREHPAVGQISVPEIVVLVRIAAHRGQRIAGESEETRDEIEQKRYTRYMKSFSDKVRDIVRKIPKGKTMTYKEVAARAGNPKAARAVGAVMRTNYDPSIPCHRVIASDGSMGGYNRGGVERKRKILFEEKVFRVGK